MIVTCESCHAKYKLPNSAAGRKTTCKKCGHKFRIPQDTDDPDDEFLSALKSATEEEAALPPVATPSTSPQPSQQIEPANKRKKKRVSWSDIVLSVVDPAILRAAPTLAAQSFNFHFVSGLVFVAALILAVVWQQSEGVLLLTFAWSMLHWGFMLRWFLGTISRFATDEETIVPFEISLVHAVLFNLSTVVIGFAVFFPTVVLPIKLLLHVGLSPLVADAGVAWEYAWLAGCWFFLGYFQVACGVFALTGNQHPLVVLKWVWKCIPGLLGVQLLTCAFGLVAAGIFYLYYLFARLILGLIGMASLSQFVDHGLLTMSFGPLLSLLIVVLGLVVLCFVVEAYVYLAAVAMFGKFFKRHRRKLGYQR